MKPTADKAAHYRCVMALLALGGGVAAMPAMAQQAPMQQGPILSEVTAAPVPVGSLATEAGQVPFSPKGMPLGAFRLFPTVETDGNYDDNVFLSSANKQGDYFFRETPEFMLRSGWSRHLLDVYSSSSFYQYGTLGEQDHVDWTGGGDGRLDIYQGLSLSASGSYSFEHLANSSPDQPTSAKSPTGFSLVHSSATLSYNPYHFGFYVGGTYDRFVYEASKLVDGALADNSDRNSDVYSAYAKAAYQFTPGYALFVQGTDNMDYYDLPVDRSGLRRNNNGYVASAGLDMLVTNLIRGQAFVGFLDQRYKAPLADVTGLTYGANVDWFATPLWTFHLVASRALNGTVLAGASTEDDRTVQVSADYRPDPQIVVTGAATYLDAAQDGTTREDRYVTGRAVIGYIINNWMMAELSDTYQVRNSTEAGQSFNDNVVMVGMKFQE